MELNGSGARDPLAGCQNPNTGLQFAAMGSKRIAIYEYVMRQLEGVTGEEAFEEVASGSGVPKSTVKKIKWRQIKDPGVSHIEALANFFRERKRLLRASRSHSAASVPAGG